MIEWAKMHLWMRNAAGPPMPDQVSERRGNPTPGKIAVAVGFLTTLTALASGGMAKPKHVGLAVMAGVAIGLALNIPALLLTRRVVLGPGPQSLRALRWPLRFAMGSVVFAVSAGLVIGEPTADNAVIAVVMVALYVALIEIIMRRQQRGQPG